MGTFAVLREWTDLGDLVVIESHDILDFHGLLQLCELLGVLNNPSEKEVAQ